MLGLGGFFFKSANNAALAKWYADVLGVSPTPGSADDTPWHQTAGPCVFTPFAATTEYFGSPDKQFMLNFRVTDLDAMVAQLRAAGTDVEINPEIFPFGRFARLNDPDGNPIELWQETV